MSRRALKRLAAVVSAPILAIGLVLAVWNGAASAHDVTGITANCDEVVVSFANFPDAGVMVHISAQVGAQAAVTKDVLVSSSTANATVAIGAETALLFGASADVTVDVTWELDGTQHVHQVLSVTCGTETTTTHPTTTTTQVGATSTTTAATGSVTGITANCDEVKVSFAGFPEAGVMVHIAAQVGAQVALTKDILVTSETEDATLDIGAETALLFGATADVGVDVTWTLNGAQHVHISIPVTCGTATTTTHPTTTTTGVGATTSTTAATTTTTHPTTTTTGVGATTSTTAATTTTTHPTTTTTGVGVTTSTTAATTTTTAPGGGTTSTTAAPGGTTTPPTTSGSVVTVGATTETANTAVLGESVTAAPASATSSGSSSGGTLPHTGDDTGALGLAALVLLSAGTTILGVVRKRRLS